MSDSIDRQAAIYAAREELESGTYFDIPSKIEALPAVQPDHNADIGKKVADEDCISRQMAIDALHTWFRDGFDEDKWWNSTHVLAAIEGLPSAQQGYKWETCFECPLSHGCPKIKGCTNEQAIEYASQIPNDCPLSTQSDHNAESDKKDERTAESAQNVQNEDLIQRKAAIEALARMMPRSYTPDGSHPADEEIFRAQEVFADCIEALEILPSAQPEVLAHGEGELIAQPETHWIPCGERLPERADNVIICYKAGDYTLVSTGIYLYKFKMWYVDVVGDLRDGVTAWMPLPEPYRGGEK